MIRPVKTTSSCPEHKRRRHFPPLFHAVESAAELLAGPVIGLMDFWTTSTSYFIADDPNEGSATD
jgi:hypothetical protein